MSRLEVLPFDETHLPDAGRLLAERHRRHRLAVGGLLVISAMLIVELLPRRRIETEVTHIAV